MKFFKPREFKWKKYHNKLITKRLKLEEYKHYRLYKGTVGLKASISYRIKSSELKMMFGLLKRKCPKKHKIHLYCFPNIGLTSKSISVRMGKGVGSLEDDWIFIIKKNSIFIELSNHKPLELEKGLKSVIKKLAIQCYIIKMPTKWVKLK